MGVRNRRRSGVYDWTSIARRVREVYAESVAAVRGQPSPDNRGVT